MANWPKHSDGRNKKVGEMTTAERRSVAKDAAARLKVEFENMPAEFFKAKDAAARLKVEFENMPAEFFKAPVKVEPVKVNDPWEAE